jgi:hypothetical protein
MLAAVRILGPRGELVPKLDLWTHIQPMKAKCRGMMSPNEPIIVPKK